MQGKTIPPGKLGEYSPTERVITDLARESKKKKQSQNSSRLGRVLPRGQPRQKKNGTVGRKKNPTSRGRGLLHGGPAKSETDETDQCAQRNVKGRGPETLKNPQGR